MRDLEEGESRVWREVRTLERQDGSGGVERMTHRTSRSVSRTSARTGSRAEGGRSASPPGPRGAGGQGGGSSPDEWADLSASNGSGWSGPSQGSRSEQEGPRLEGQEWPEGQGRRRQAWKRGEADQVAGGAVSLLSSHDDSSLGGRSSPEQNRSRGSHDPSTGLSPRGQRGGRKPTTRGGLGAEPVSRQPGARGVIRGGPPPPAAPEYSPRPVRKAKVSAAAKVRDWATALLAPSPEPTRGWGGRGRRARGGGRGRGGEE